MIFRALRLLRLRLLWSSALLLTLGGCWLRDRTDGDLLFFCLPGGQVQAIGANHGDVTLFFSNISLGAEERGLTWEYERPKQWECEELRATLLLYTQDEEARHNEIIAAARKWNRFAWEKSQADVFRVRGAWFQYINFPFWLLLVLPGIWFAAHLMILLSRWRGKRRLKRGVCVRCGYDIRFSGGRCSECGTVVETVTA